MRTAEIHQFISVQKGACIFVENLFKGSFFDKILTDPCHDGVFLTHYLVTAFSKKQYQKIKGGKQAVLVI